MKIGFTKASGRTHGGIGDQKWFRLIAANGMRDGVWFADAYAMLDYGFTVSEGTVDSEKAKEKAEKACEIASAAKCDVHA